MKEIDVINAFISGYKKALYDYAWMKDGIYYVGSCGTTLKEAYKKIPELNIQQICDLSIGEQPK